MSLSFHPSAAPFIDPGILACLQYPRYAVFEHG